MRDTSERDTPEGHTYEGHTYEGHTYEGHTYEGHTYDVHTQDVPMAHEIFAAFGGRWQCRISHSGAQWQLGSLGPCGELVLARIYQRFWFLLSSPSCCPCIEGSRSHMMCG
jgi:hypothetical protein